MNSGPRTLAEALAPLPASDFLHNYLGKKFLYSPGERGRFAGLLPWADLNDILRHHRLDTPRIRLVKEGKAVPPGSWLSAHHPVRSPQTRITKLRPVELTAHLRDGATLIVDSVDELQEPVADLSENVELVTGARTQVNMYAGWRTSHGFDLHWDGHDVLIFQISGRKHWKVYGMTREHPLASDASRKGQPPEQPLWEGLLNDGDLLYIPRGWWHVALPLNEPTLHLTMGVHTRTGIDLLNFLHGRMTESVAVRRDLPRFASAEEKAEHLNEIRKAWLEICRPDAIDQYFAHSDARTEPRPGFSLPWSATPGILPPEGHEFQVRWNVPRPVDLSPGSPDSPVEFECFGKRWTFAGQARPLLDALQRNGVCTVSDLMTAANGALDEGTVRAFIRELTAAGIVRVVTGEPVP